MHIQTLSFDKATDALAHIETDKSRSEMWKAEGSAMYSMEINFVKIYPHSESVEVYQITEEKLRERVEAEKGGVS